MIRRMLTGELRRNIGASVVLSGFFFVTVLLASGGAGTAARLLGAVDELFVAARAPDVVQLSTGDVDESQIVAFADRRPEVVDWLVSPAAVATGDALWFGDSSEADSFSVMDHYFVTQNDRFDVLLGLDGKPVHVEPGQIGVPIYDMVRHNLSIGDSIQVKTASGEMSFVISSFARDAQMNPAILSSKRFVVAASDLEELRGVPPSSEYLIEFRLAPGTSTAAFMDDYRTAGLPQAGPSVDAGLLRTASFLSDGLVVVVLLLVGLLLLVIGIICLRFAVTSAIQSSYRELGVLRAIGAPLGFIRRSFSAKYVVLAAAGCLIGWVGALALVPRLTANALLYTGPPASPAGMLVASAVAAAVLFVVVIVSCLLAVRAVGRVSATEALREGITGGPGSRRWRAWSLARGRTPVTWYLGMRDLHLRPRSYLVPLVVFVIATFLLIVPVNFLTTATAPSFVQYMGMGRSQVRLDAPAGGSDPALPEQVMARVSNDSRVVQAAQVTTYRCALMPDSGEEATTLVQTGDFDAFPITYLEGRSPTTSGELALSFLNADEQAASVGDTVRLQDGDGRRDVKVVGIYQDITNGGRTAKTAGAVSCGEPIWVTINLDLDSGADTAQFVTDYTGAFEGLRAYSMSDYIGQTLGQTLDSLVVAVRGSLLVSTVVVALIAAMFTGILISRDSGPNTVLRALGAPAGLVGRQYVVRLLIVLVVGVVLGTVLAGTLGEGIVGALMSLLGAPRITFQVNPLVSYLACPALLIAAVATTTWLVARFGQAHTTRPTED